MSDDVDKFLSNAFAFGEEFNAIIVLYDYCMQCLANPMISKYCIVLSTLDDVDVDHDAILVMLCPDCGKLKDERDCGQIKNNVVMLRDKVQVYK